MKKKLYLHIGEPKTGTSSIQRYLRKNAKALAVAGYFYPISRAYSNASHELGHQLLNSREYKANKSHIDHSVAQLLSQLKKNKLPNVVISTEVLWSCKPSDVLTLFEDYDIHLIIYIRRFSDVVSSGYCERVKSSYWDPERRSLDEYIQFRVNTVEQRYRRIIRWYELLGKERVALRSFERAQFVDHDLIADFMSCLNFPEPVQGLKRISEKANPQLSCEVTYLFHLINNQDFSAHELFRYKRLIQAYALAKGLTEVDSMLNTRQQAMLDECAGPHDQQLAERFLNQEQLFVQPPKPVQERAEGAESEASAQRLLQRVKGRYCWCFWVPASWFYHGHRLLVRLRGWLV